MKFEVSAQRLGALKFNETDTVKSVLQNVAVILATPKGTVPMYRDFGVNTEFLDLPMPVAKVRMIAEIREAVEAWEPRARVVGVRFSEEAAAEGVLIPVVEVEIVDE